MRTYACSLLTSVMRLSTEVYFLCIDASSFDVARSLQSCRQVVGSILLGMSCWSIIAYRLLNQIHSL